DGQVPSADLIAGRFASAVLAKENETASKALPNLEAASMEDGYGSYLAGLFWTKIKKNPTRGREDFVRAREMGQWGRRFDLAFQETAIKETPVLQPSKEGKP